MQQYLSHFTAGWQSFIAQVAHPGWGNFFWLLTVASVIVFLLERIAKHVAQELSDAGD